MGSCCLSPWEVLPGSGGGGSPAGGQSPGHSLTRILPLLARLCGSSQESLAEATRLRSSLSHS